jgi:hypothetical protein
VWAQSSGSAVTNYLKKLHDTWNKMSGVADASEAHQSWSECFSELIRSLEKDASSYVRSFSVSDRARVSRYKNLLWIWHRLDAARWNMSRVPLRVGKREKIEHEVDHTVSFALWEKRLATGLPTKVQDLDEAKGVANCIGNCTLLEKNFNISKSAKGMKCFLEQIHEFKEHTLSLTDWETALDMPGELVDPEAASLDAIVGAIENRELRIRAELVEFVEGKRVRKDV